MYATMKQRTDWMPAVRHKRSQNPGVVYTLLDEAVALVGAFMRISSRMEGKFGSVRRRVIGEAVGGAGITADARCPCQIAAWYRSKRLAFIVVRGVVRKFWLGRMVCDVSQIRFCTQVVLIRLRFRSSSPEPFQ